MISPRKRLVLFLILAALVLSFIFYNSTRTGVQSDGASKGLMSAILAIIDPRGVLDTGIVHFIIRKAAHFTEFFAYGVCLCGAAIAFEDIIKAPRVSLTLLVALVSAVCDELIQEFTAARSASPKDIVLDFFGALCGVLLSRLITKAIRKRRVKKRKTAE